MAEDIEVEESPTSSEPSTPQQSSTQFLTPVTFQHPFPVHTSAIQALQLNSASPSFYPTPIHSPYPPSVLQSGAFGSSMSSLPCSANMIDTKKARKNSKKEGKTRSSSSRKASSSTSLKARTTSRKNPKLTSSTTAEDTPATGSSETRKAHVRWEDDKNEKGESAMSLLLNWITTYGNWARYKNRNIVKKNTIEHVIQYLAENGIAPRKVNAVLDKSFVSAVDWLNGTGQGVMDDLEVEKDANGWADDDPQYLAKKKSLIEDYVVKHKCKYYYELEDTMGTRDKSTRLSSANSANALDPNESLDCLGLSKQSNVSPNDTIRSFEDRFENGLADDPNEDLDTLDLENQDVEIKDPTPPKSSQQSYRPSSSGSVPRRRLQKEGGESQAIRHLSLPASEAPSDFHRLEQAIIDGERHNHGMSHAITDLALALKPKSNPTLLLSVDDQRRQAEIEAELQACKLKAAQLDLRKTEQAMSLEVANAKGKFIAQMMHDNKWTYAEAKTVADEVYKHSEVA
ncbi:hypothetical protein DFH28DRAFT_1124079 [Melampsora americana]|nr:hypothetical protein DFH28DRAFT_1124079 [Melampsora americana]